MGAGAEAAERVSGNFSANGIEAVADSLTSEIGDPFLKQLLARPDVYKTSLTTTKNCIKAFYAIKFNATGPAAAKAKVYRNELANFFTEETSQVDADDMRAKMTATGTEQLTAFTMSMGALPAFQADIK